MASQAEQVNAAAERIVKLAEREGLACGIPPGGGASLKVLTEAFAISIVDAVNFSGDPTRMQFALETMRQELEIAVAQQDLLRRGIKPKAGMRYGRES